MLTAIGRCSETYAPVFGDARMLYVLISAFGGGGSLIRRASAVYEGYQTQYRSRKDGTVVAEQEH